jgi:hypothetical protein
MHEPYSGLDIKIDSKSMAVFDIIIYICILLNYYDHIGMDKKTKTTTKNKNKKHQKHTDIVQWLYV